MLEFRQTLNSDFTEAWTVINDARNAMIAIGRKQWTPDYPSPEIILSDINSGNAYVIIQDDAVVAYGVIAVNGEPEYANIIGHWISNGDYVVVHRLAVAPNHRHEGIGRDFFYNVGAICKDQNIHSIKVDTNYDNTEMLSLLPKLGYVRCGKIDYHDKGMRIAFEKYWE